MPAPDCNATLYRRFEDERTRPAMDLLARVGAAAPATVVDLGCGPGNSTELLVARWPAAEVTGVDNSPSMLEAARARLPAVRFVEADAAAWRAETPCDVIFANALLQWVLDHARLYPRLVDALAPQGWLAVQVPDNHAEPSHALMRDAARAIGRADVVDGAESERAPIGTFDDHWRWLAPICRRVDLWRTEYVHALEGPDAIIEWVRATGLRPFLARLSADEQARFLAHYRDGLSRAYPEHADGKALLRFPRLFVVAQR
jgi:trans-aconitate 2-methyltransferase